MRYALLIGIGTILGAVFTCCFLFIFKQEGLQNIGRFNLSQTINQKNFDKGCQDTGRRWYASNTIPVRNVIGQCTSYSINDHGIYFGDSIISSSTAHMRTFGSAVSYITDGKSVFFLLNKIEGADPETFTPLFGLFGEITLVSVDKNYAYESSALSMLTKTLMPTPEVFATSQPWNEVNTNSLLDTAD